VIELPRESWRGRHEMPSAWRNDALSAELGSERVADPLDRLRVATRSHEGWNGCITEDVERWPGFAWQPPAMGATNKSCDLFGQWSVVDVRCACQLQELAQHHRVAVKPIAKKRVAEALEVRNLRVVGNEVVERRLD
jgi:hypothetical protein